MLWREKCPYYGDGGVLIMGIEVTLNTVAQAGSEEDSLLHTGEGEGLPRTTEIHIL